MRYFGILLLAIVLSACSRTVTSQTPIENMRALPPRPSFEGEFVYNLPCKVINIHMEKPGKAVLFLWLHGGVKDRKKHDLFQLNHLDCCEADDMIVDYLRRRGIKAVALFPICHRAVNPECVAWRDVWPDVKRMLDDYVDKEIVDPQRIYVAGSSDGGRGTWDLTTMHPEVFASAIAMSCEGPRYTTVPTFFYNTSSEEDCTAEVESLQRQGSNILVYKFGADYKHGDDAAECTDEGKES